MASEPRRPVPAHLGRARMSQADLAYRNLRYAIVEWRVEPGAWLTESELQELSGFARTPTREAAGRLIADGLLSVMPRNGYQVADVSVADAAALFDVWEALAPMTGRLAVGRVDELAMTLLRRAVTTTTPLAAGVCGAPGRKPDSASGRSMKSLPAARLLNARG